MIGAVGVTNDELGYMFAPEVWRQGYATEACELAITRAFADGRDHLKAGVWADNAGSLRLLSKLGFRITANNIALHNARRAEVAGQALRLDRANWALLTAASPDL